MRSKFHSLAKYCTILLLISILAQTFSKGLILLNFNMNRAEIAATKCENRFKPKSSCKGSCHLTKQLKADEQQQDSPYNSGSKEKFEVLLFAEMNAGQTMVFISNFLHHHTRYAEPSTQEFTGSVFHPPAFT